MHLRMVERENQPSGSFLMTLIPQVKVFLQDLEVLLPNTITLGIRFQPGNQGRGTNIQAIVCDIFLKNI